MVTKVRRILTFIYGFDINHNLDRPTDIFCDNNGMLQFVNTGTVSQRTNYLSQDACVKYQYIGNKIVNAKKVDTTDNLADLLTKPISGKTMEHF